MSLYKWFVRPKLFKKDPEEAHQWAMKMLAKHPHFAHLLTGIYPDEKRLHVTALGITFPNPIGLAAGFDKNAVYIEYLPRLGFGFLEVGTITQVPQPGNPKPRIRRIEEAEALWNHLGFNNDGADTITERLKNAKPKIPIGVNIGKSKSTPNENAFLDYSAAFEKLAPYGDYFVINISSPNTPGLRQLQDKQNIRTILRAVQAVNHHSKPVLVKVSPDLSFEAIDELVEVGLQEKIAGFVATNTTVSRQNLPADIPSEGGISGRPIRERSTEVIRRIKQRGGHKICVIGCGGIFSADDAFEKILAGATLLQLYTGLIYEGPSIVKDINQGLLSKMRRAGIASIEEAIGRATS